MFANAKLFRCLLVAGLSATISLSAAVGQPSIEDEGVQDAALSYLVLQTMYFYAESVNVDTHAMMLDSLLSREGVKSKVDEYLASVYGVAIGESVDYHAINYDIRKLLEVAGPILESAAPQRKLKISRALGHARETALGSQKISDTERRSLAAFFEGVDYEKREIPDVKFEDRVDEITDLRYVSWTKHYDAANGEVSRLRLVLQVDPEYVPRKKGTLGEVIEQLRGEGCRAVLSISSLDQRPRLFRDERGLMGSFPSPFKFQFRDGSSAKGTLFHYQIASFAKLSSTQFETTYTNDLFIGPIVYSEDDFFSNLILLGDGEAVQLRLGSPQDLQDLDVGEQVCTDMAAMAKAMRIWLIQHQPEFMAIASTQVIESKDRIRATIADLEAKIAKAEEQRQSAQRREKRNSRDAYGNPDPHYIKPPQGSYGSWLVDRETSKLVRAEQLLREISSKKDPYRRFLQR